MRWRAAPCIKAPHVAHGAMWIMFAQYTASWGLRRLAAVVDEAARAGLAFEERIGMPANNFMLVFRRGAEG